VDGASWMARRGWLVVDGSSWMARRGWLVVDGSSWMARRGWLVVYWRIFGHQLSREIYDLDHSEKEIPCANEISGLGFKFISFCCCNSKPLSCSLVFALGHRFYKTRYVMSWLRTLHFKTERHALSTDCE